jgi:hypothetical protein
MSLRENNVLTRFKYIESILIYDNATISTE